MSDEIRQTFTRCANSRKDQWQENLAILKRDITNCEPAFLKFFGDQALKKIICECHKPKYKPVVEFVLHFIASNHWSESEKILEEVLLSETISLLQNCIRNPYEQIRSNSIYLLGQMALIRESLSNNDLFLKTILGQNCLGDALRSTEKDDIRSASSFLCSMIDSIPDMQTKLALLRSSHSFIRESAVKHLSPTAVNLHLIIGTLSDHSNAATCIAYDKLRNFHPQDIQPADVNNILRHASLEKRRGPKMHIAKLIRSWLKSADDDCAILIRNMGFPHNADDIAKAFGNAFRGAELGSSTNELAEALYLRRLETECGVATSRLAISNDEIISYVMSTDNAFYALEGLAYLVSFDVPFQASLLDVFMRDGVPEEIRQKAVELCSKNKHNLPCVLSTPEYLQHLSASQIETIIEVSDIQQVVKTLYSQKERSQHFKAMEILSLKAYGDLNLAKISLAQLRDMIATPERWTENELESMIKLIFDLCILYSELRLPGIELLQINYYNSLRFLVLEGYCKLAIAHGRADESMLKPLVDARMESSLPCAPKQMLKAFFEKFDFTDEDLQAALFSVVDEALNIRTSKSLDVRPVVAFAARLHNASYLVRLRGRLIEFLSADIYGTCGIHYALNLVPPLVDYDEREKLAIEQYVKLTKNLVVRDYLCNKFGISWVPHEKPRAASLKRKLEPRSLSARERRLSKKAKQNHSNDVIDK